MFDPLDNDLRGLLMPESDNGPADAVGHRFWRKARKQAVDTSARRDAEIQQAPPSEPFALEIADRRGLARREIGKAHGGDAQPASRTNEDVVCGPRGHDILTLAVPERNVLIGSLEDFYRQSELHASLGDLTEDVRRLVLEMHDGRRYPRRPPM